MASKTVIRPISQARNLYANTFELCKRSLTRKTLICRRKWWVQFSHADKAQEWTPEAFIFLIKFLIEMEKEPGKNQVDH